MNDRTSPPADTKSRLVKGVFIAFALIAGFFLLSEHRAHVISYLPWLLLAACPLLHMFMHGGHGGHRHGGAQPAREQGNDSTRAAERSGAAGSEHRHGA